MRVFVELSHDVDAASWGERNAAGLAADASPYGLHHLEEHGDSVVFRTAHRRPLITRAERAISGRAWGLQPVHAALAHADRARRGADVVLCMDERNGIPAALSSRSVPVVTGVAWLEDPDALSPTYRHLAVRALSRAAAVFVECSAMREPLRDGFGVPEDKLHYVTLGIDENHFAPSAAPAVPGRVFSVGDDRMRDYDTLVAALHRVHAERPHLSAEIATTLPIDLPADWGTMHRRRMDHAVKDCYQRAEVVALALKPTRQGSGLTVILETMASGRPLVVTDNPGLSDYVVDGETGFLVPPGDPAAMAHAVRTLLDDPDLAARMGRAGRARVLQHFTSKHFAAGLRDVLLAGVRNG